jgi:hypothetical protein
MGQQAMQPGYHVYSTSRIEQDMVGMVGVRFARIFGLQANERADRREAVGDSVIGLAGQRIQGSLKGRVGVHRAKLRLPFSDAYGIHVLLLIVFLLSLGMTRLRAMTMVRRLGAQKQSLRLRNQLNLSKMTNTRRLLKKALRRV